MNPKIVFINGRFLTQPATGVQRFAIELLKALDLILESDQTFSQKTGFICLIPKETEDKIYKSWENGGYFKPVLRKKEEGREKDIFSVMMPPPNVTGVLHLGHAFEHTLSDIEVRFQRMLGKKTLWLPGTDHAAVATQAKVEKVLMEKEGYKNPRQELGREKLLEKIREYANNSQKTILGQIRKIGDSCDFDHLAYTFDEQRSKAVNEAFYQMYVDGLIERDFRAVNWSIRGQSTLADDEIVYVDRKAKLYTFKYSKNFPIEIATTRPETKLGDTAVAVNPSGKYKEFIGQEFTVDVGAKEPLKIKIIGDISVDPDFGTGALGVTPAHSQIDYEMSLKHDLKLIQVIGEDGKMTENAGKDYAGLSVEEAREKFVLWLKEQDLLSKEEEIDQSVGTSDRFHDPVEVLPKLQWFVRVNKKIERKNNKTLKDLMSEAIKTGHNGDKNKRVEIIPKRFENIYFHWIDNLRDWCLSRQIWWGHRLPVWYCQDCGEVIVSKGVEPRKCSKCDLSNLKRDEDTLDTWFSAALWPFSTLGYPDDTEMLKEFFPTSWMQMGYEIIFQWMSKMILMSTYLMDEIPFYNVYIHGMVRDKNGKKFSKSSGNNLDPLEMIDKYGADALRLALISGVSPGQDTKFYEEKVEHFRNFVNKLWNVSRFILTTFDFVKDAESKLKDLNLTELDKHILNKFNVLIGATTKELNGYSFSMPVELFEDFMWHELADKYLESAKIEKQNKEIILSYVLENLLKLMHPYLPFITENIFDFIYQDKKLIIEKWPQTLDFKINESFGDMIYNSISAIRNLKKNNNIEQAKKAKAVIISPKSKDIFEAEKDVIIKMARLENLEILEKGEKPQNSVMEVLDGNEVYLLLEGLIDIEKEKQRIKKDIEQKEKYIASLEKQLSNEDFLKNAPKAVVEKNQDNLRQAKEDLGKIINS